MTTKLSEDEFRERLLALVNRLADQLLRKYRGQGTSVIIAKVQGDVWEEAAKKARSCMTDGRPNSTSRIVSRLEARARAARKTP